MRSLFIVLGIFGIAYGISMQKHEDNHDDVMPIIKNYSKTKEKEKNITLRLYGFRWAGQDKVYDGKIHEIDLGYSIDKSMKFEEARQFFYNFVDELIELINSNSKSSKHFYHFPIDYSDFHIFLAFDYENKGFLKAGDVSSIHISENQIFYFIVQKDGKDNDIKFHKMSDDVYRTKFSQETTCIRRPVSEDLEIGKSLDENRK